MHLEKKMKTKYLIETSRIFETEKEAMKFAEMVKDSFHKIQLHIHNHDETGKGENKPCVIKVLKDDTKQ